MYDIEIELYINYDENIIKYFNGVFDIKVKMPVFVMYPSSYIFNIGRHWVSVFIDEFKVGEYFDSFGLPPPHKILKFMEKNCSKWNYNIHRVQSVSSAYCGQYSLLFLRHCSLGLNVSDFIKYFDCESDIEKDSRISYLFLRTFGNTTISRVENAAKRFELLNRRIMQRNIWQ